LNKFVNNLKKIKVLLKDPNIESTEDIQHEKVLVFFLLKDAELLLLLQSDLLLLFNIQHIESNRFGQRPALANGDDIADLDLEARRTMGWDVGVSLLVTIIS